MDLLPAIDIRGGKCVRLLKGDFHQETRYEANPADLAQRYADLGARWLHVVDLDGAKDGMPQNLDLIATMAQTKKIEIQLGGGIRSEIDLIRALSVVKRVVIGSLAATSPDLVEHWLKEFDPNRLTLALDVRLDQNNEPFIATHGWTKDSKLTLWAALDRYSQAGLRNVLCTDVDRDGALNGPNLKLYKICVERCPGISFQASGGVRNIEDLCELAKTGVTFAISGKALLEGLLSDKEMQSFLPNE